VESIFQKLNLPTIDYSFCRRKGETGIRPLLVQWKLIRERDKYAIFQEKAALRDDPATQSIFINLELTKPEHTRDGKVHEAGRNLKAENKDAKFHTRNGVLTVMLNGGRSQQYVMDRNGEIVEQWLIPLSFSLDSILFLLKLHNMQITNTHTTIYNHIWPHSYIS